MVPLSSQSHTSPPVPCERAHARMHACPLTYTRTRTHAHTHPRTHSSCWNACPAQVTRTRWMVACAKKYPAYQFDLNYGHLTAGHREALVVRNSSYPPVACTTHLVLLACNMWKQTLDGIFKHRLCLTKSDITNSHCASRLLNSFFTEDTHKKKKTIMITLSTPSQFGTTP